MVSRTPGRCTLMATSSPVFSVARCTCASEAEPTAWDRYARTPRRRDARIRRQAHPTPWNTASGRVGAQFGEFVAEALRQNLGAHRQNLAHFDERGAERLEHEAHFDRSQAVQHVELLDDSGDLPQSFDLATARQMVARGEIVPASEQCQRFVGYARSRLGNGLLERVRRVDGPVRRRSRSAFAGVRIGSTLLEAGRP